MYFATVWTLLQRVTDVRRFSEYSRETLASRYPAQVHRQE